MVDEKHLLVIVWRSSIQPKANLIIGFTTSKQLKIICFH